MDPDAIGTVPKEGTILWGTSSYHQQEVNATVSSPDLNVLEVVPTGPKMALSVDFFNVTNFEWWYLFYPAGPGRNFHSSLLVFLLRWR
jgi:hypothetical protein